MPAASTVTLILVFVLVAALATYLSVIAYLLNKTSFTLGTVLIGVRAIEQATRPVGEVVNGIGDDVVAIEGALGGLAAQGDEDRAPTG